MFAIPTRYRKEYRNFLDSLIEEEILNSYYVYELTSCRHLSLNAKYFDFDNWEWKIDWNNLESPDVNVEQPFESEPLKDPLVDYHDLLILEELQMDSLRSLSEIAKELNMNPRTVLYHFNEHIIRRGIINQYYIKWWYKKISEEKKISLILQVYNVDEKKIRILKEEIEKLPFTFFDAYSLENKFYIAQQLLSAEHINNILKYLTKIKKIHGINNFSFEFIEEEHAFTIPYERFNEREGWTFHSKEALKEVLLITSKILGR
jgi:DNA-binding Lrp family transcriptional regulator